LEFFKVSGAYQSCVGDEGAVGEFFGFGDRENG
jgi:hypothetical protein